MSALITPEEKNVALRNVVTEQDYADRLKTYAQKKGTTVEKLRELSKEDLLVARQMGHDPEVYRKQKLADLAETVINTIGGRQ
ncbi:hypothetical protein [Marinobacter goseongensis]|uniref:hypothetical protein n=1 Tax=Marinobacter goseongensis TaxID=453838 RepID=UPI002005AEB2|nr:hypothetical protein [Marinobacter goseongensis]MCK7553047.1 hypothetical protein [Marinobacter goseongensis]